MPVIPNANPPNPNIKSELLPVKSNKVDSVKEIKPIIPVSELPNLNETVNGSSAAAKKDVEIKKDREIRKSDSVSFILDFLNTLWISCTWVKGLLSKRSYGVLIEYLLSFFLFVFIQLCNIVFNQDFYTYTVSTKFY